MNATSTPLLTECRLIIDALAGTTVLRLNGQEYSVDHDATGTDFLRLTGRKPRDLWTVKNGACNCPAFKFSAYGCKHVAAVDTGLFDKDIQHARNQS